MSVLWDCRTALQDEEDTRRANDLRLRKLCLRLRSLGIDPDGLVQTADADADAARIARVRKQREAHALAAVNARKARPRPTPPPSRSERRHRAQQWTIVTLACIAATVAAILWQAGYLDGRGNSVDRQPMGERRSAAQQEVERG